VELNADFSKRVAVHAARLAWVESPTRGVERRMLDRIGGEVARATSIVRYAPNSHFPAHVHAGGEEFLVLDGVFQDEAGDYPAGSYIRNPPTSRHTPGSHAGCTIFVKLWQFDPDDRLGVRIATQDHPWTIDREHAGVEYIALYADATEQVRLERWAAHAEVTLPELRGGLELLVLDGSMTEGSETFTGQSWLRLPVGAPLHARAGPQGCRLWLKSGHLSEAVRTRVPLPAARR
jgi:hypothetical protein